jgi:hypothetical protein
MRKSGAVVKMTTYEGADHFLFFSHRERLLKQLSGWLRERIPSSTQERHRSFDEPGSGESAVDRTAHEAEVDTVALRNVPHAAPSVNRSTARSALAK